MTWRRDTSAVPVSREMDIAKARNRQKAREVKRTLDAVNGCFMDVELISIPLQDESILP